MFYAIHVLLYVSSTIIINLMFIPSVGEYGPWQNIYLQVSIKSRVEDIKSYE